MTAAIPVTYAICMQKILIQNRRALHDFEVLERFTAGIVLFGYEVKSLKSGQGHFTGAYLSIKNGEVYLNHFHIPPYKKATLENIEPERPRKLLLKKQEILKLANTLNTKGVTLIPLVCGLENGKIKIEFGIARGKKHFDKRESIKKKDQRRQIEKAIKYRQSI